MSGISAWRMSRGGPVAPLLRGRQGLAARSTSLAQLDVRTGHRPKGTEDAASALSGLQCLATPLTEVNSHSGVRRHGFYGFVPAVGARDFRVKFDSLICLSH